MQTTVGDASLAAIATLPLRELSLSYCSVRSTSLAPLAEHAPRSRCWPRPACRSTTPGSRRWRELDRAAPARPLGRPRSPATGWARSPGCHALRCARSRPQQRRGRRARAARVAARSPSCASSTRADDRSMAALARIATLTTLVARRHAGRQRRRRGAGGLPHLAELGLQATQIDDGALPCAGPAAAQARRSAPHARHPRRARMRLQRQRGCDIQWGGRPIKRGEPWIP